MTVAAEWDPEFLRQMVGIDWPSVLLCAVSIGCLRQVVTLYREMHAVGVLRRLNGMRLTPKEITAPHRVLIVVPVLRESHTIAGTLEHFASMGLSPGERIVLVTTERETVEAKPGDRSTMDVLADLRGKFVFSVLHYPDPSGTKADQLNWALTYLLSNESVPCELIYFAIYDADSRPQRATFRRLRELLSKYPDTMAVQQSAVFYGNYGSLGRGRGLLCRTFLQANAVRQTRFTLAYELPRLLARGTRRPGCIGRATYAHCVGHGLFLRGDLAERVQFPAGSILEDMFMGFLLNYLGVPVRVLPVLDNAESPSSFTSLLFQRSRWFLGPLRCPAYLAYARRQFPEVAPSWDHLLIAIHGVLDALGWAVTTPATVVVIVSVTSKSTALRTMSFALAVLYAVSVLVALGAGRALVRAAPEMRGAPTRVVDWLKVLCVYPLVLLFHSFPAYLCVYELVRRRRDLLFGKTEREVV